MRTQQSPPSGVPTVDFDAMPTLGDIPRYQTKERPEAVALAFEGRATTYGDFDWRTNQVAQALLAAGLSKGDRIAYLGKNSDHYFELLSARPRWGR